MKLTQVRRVALALPQSAESPHHESTSFRVRGRIYATAPPGGAYLHVFVDENVRELALAMHAGCAQPLLWGGRVRGLRIVLDVAPVHVVAGLLWEAWRHKAPKALAATVPTAPRR